MRIASSTHATTSRSTTSSSGGRLRTYQFTDRLLVRNINEYNTFDRTFGFNLLLTYRVNAGTVFYIGYDDRLEEGFRIDEEIFPTSNFERTRRAFFTKLQYLFRY